ncbi:MAG: hypothetical protein HOV79_16350, partial [Hamadaea sp.]|nr:hypothetical protein [Hamadaea sp.]
PWDHKPKLREMFDMQPGLDGHIRTNMYPSTAIGVRQMAVDYDVWSNIHYGYVGARAGIPAKTLILGSHIAPGAGQTDAGDDAAIRLGIELAQKYPKNHIMTGQELWYAVHSHLDQLPGKVVPR